MVSRPNFWDDLLVQLPPHLLHTQKCSSGRSQSLRRGGHCWKNITGLEFHWNSGCRSFQGPWHESTLAGHQLLSVSLLPRDKATETSLGLRSPLWLRILGETMMPISLGASHFVPGASPVIMLRSAWEYGHTGRSYVNQWRFLLEPLFLHLGI